MKSGTTLAKVNGTNSTGWSNENLCPSNEHTRKKLEIINPNHPNIMLKSAVHRAKMEANPIENSPLTQVIWEIFLSRAIDNVATPSNAAPCMSSIFIPTIFVL